MLEIPLRAGIDGSFEVMTLALRRRAAAARGVRWQARSQEELYGDGRDPVGMLREEFARVPAGLLREEIAAKRGCLAMQVLIF